MREFLAILGENQVKMEGIQSMYTAPARQTETEIVAWQVTRFIPIPEFDRSPLYQRPARLALKNI